MVSFILDIGVMETEVMYLDMGKHKLLCLMDLDLDLQSHDWIDI